MVISLVITDGCVPDASPEILDRVGVVDRQNARLSQPFDVQGPFLGIGLQASFVQCGQDVLSGD